MEIRKDKYFATLEGDEYIDSLHMKISSYYEDMQAIALSDLIKRSYRAYYGGSLHEGLSPIFEGSKLTRQGQQGEITALKVNHFRNLIKHTKQLTTSQKPAFSCRANNSDYKSQAQTILGNGLVDYYMREHKLRGYLSQAVENALVMGEGWLHCPWNPSSGSVYQRDGEKEVKEGDIEFSVHSPFDIIREIHLSHNDKNQWCIVRNFKNKWDLVAKYPQFEEEILRGEPNKYENSPDDINETFLGQRSKPDELIPVYTFYHDKTPSMKKGRITIFTGSVELYDGPFPYEDIPVYGLMPDKIIGTPYGYSPAYDILAGQQAVDILTSTIMSNQASNGVQSIWTKRGDSIRVSSLGTGMKNFQSDEMPKPIQLTQTAPEIFNFRNSLIGEMETISGISSTVRGNPEANLKSGNALALVVSQSIQFASMLEENYHALIEDSGTALITHLRKFSKTPRVAAIVGNYNRPFMKEFNADDLSQINRVVVEQVSPLSKTISGRVEIANQLLQQGMIENPKQYLTVLQTGQLDPAIEGRQSALLNIRAENEAMQEGEVIKAVVTENHADHIKEHKSLLENPDAKKNEELVGNVLSHIQEHLDLWRSADPAVLMITGQQPAPPPANQMPQQPQPGAAQGNSNASEVVANTGPIAPDQMPDQPNMPTNPLTGQVFDNVTGGL